MSMTTVYADVASEYEALRKKTGLVDYAGAGLFRVTGTAAPKLLGSVSSRSADFLLEGQISAALMLREDGTVVADTLIHCTGPEYLIEVWPVQRAAAGDHLLSVAESYADASVEDVSDSYRLFGVEGPESFRIAGKFLSFPISSMAYRSFVTVEWNGTSLLLSRTGVTGEYGYKLHVPADNAGELREQLVSLGAQPAGLDALDVCRMEMRFANLEAESGGYPSTPFDLGLQWMVDFQHEFIGRDAVHGQWEAGLVQLPICWSAEGAAESVPVHGTPLSVADATVGEVTHAVWSPALERVIGTARVDREVACSGLEFALGSSPRPSRSVSAPFLVATSFGLLLE